MSDIPTIEKLRAQLSAAIARAEKAEQGKNYAEFNLKEMQDLLRVAQGEIGHDLIVHSFGGMCPTQADGMIHGHAFYFRARHGDWELTVAPSGEDPVCHKSPLYYVEGDDDTHGDMSYQAVLAIIGQHMNAVRERIAASLPTNHAGRGAE